MEVYQPKGSRMWYYDVSLPGQPRVRKSTRETIKWRAQLKANEELQKARDTGSVDVLLRKAPVLEVFAPEFLQWVEKAQSHGKWTRKLYRNGWRLLKDTPLAKMPMDKITNHECSMVTFPGSNFNANTALRTLGRMRSKAKEMKRLYGDLPKIKLLPEEPRWMKMSEANALLIDSHWLLEEESENSRDVFRTIRSSGFRPSECFAMRWEYTDLDRGVYRNRQGKTPAAQREVPLGLPPFGLQFLKDRWKRMGCPSEGWVFPSPRAACGHMVTIHEAFTRARKRAGLPKEMVLYTARHGVCTAVAEVTTLKETMQLMGHSDIKTALKYQHPDSKAVGQKLWERMKTQDEKFLEKVGVKL